MNVLIAGSGGREHAITWKLVEQNEVNRVFVAPGNAGTDVIAENVDISATDVQRLTRFAVQNSVDMAVIGPDDSLAAGLSNSLQNRGIPTFGPTQEAAQIESSKTFAKNLMEEYGIPTARATQFEDALDAADYIEQAGYPIVLKEDGLKRGKGVHPCKTIKEAKKICLELAGKPILAEEFLEGTEISLHAWSDGENYAMLPSSQDHKTIYEHGEGSMSGGMGTIAPSPYAGTQFVEQLGDLVVAPALEALKKEGMPFSGMLYPGIMLTAEGPKTLEYNARFGDPEAQVYMRLLSNSLLKTLQACASGKLNQALPDWSAKSAICVILASAGYPERSTDGVPIEGLEDAEAQEDIVIFHSGTKRQKDQIVTNGGRVLGVTATGDNLVEARDKVYSVIDSYIHFDGMQYRRDIGLEAIYREKQKRPVKRRSFFKIHN